MHNLHKGNHQKASEKLISLLNILLGWGNLFLFITVARFYYCCSHADILILPIAIMNITAAVAVTLLIFCLSDITICGRRVRALLTAAPSLIVISGMVFFTLGNGFKWVFYFI